LLLAGGAAWATPAPKNLRASDGKFPDKVQVTWKKVDGAQGYFVYRSTTANVMDGGRFPLVTVTSVDDSTAGAGTAYRYWVTAVVNGVESELSNFDDGSRKNAGSGGGTGGITKVGAGSVTISGATTTAYSADTLLINRGTGAFVTGSNTVILLANGTWTGTQSETSTIAPQVVTGTVTAVTGTSAVLNGTITSDGGAPITKRMFSAVGTDMPIPQSLTEWIEVDGTNFRYPLTGLTPGGTYSIRAVVQNEDQRWGQGALVTFTTPGLPPPAGVAATDGKYKDRVQVTWPAVNGAEAYVVYRGIGNNAGAATPFSPVTVPVFDDFTAVKGTIYTYWITTVKNGGAGWSSQPDTGFVKGTKAPKNKK